MAKQNSIMSQMSQTNTSFSNSVYGSYKLQENNVIFVTKDSINNPAKINEQFEQEHAELVKQQQQLQQKKDEEEIKKGNQIYNNPNKKVNIQLGVANIEHQQEEEQLNNRLKIHEKKKQSKSQGSRQFVSFDQIISNKKTQLEQEEDDIYHENSGGFRHSTDYFSDYQQGSATTKSQQNLPTLNTLSNFNNTLEDLYYGQKKVKKQFQNNKEQCDYATSQFNIIQMGKTTKMFSELVNKEKRINQVEKLVRQRKESTNSKPRQSFNIDPSLFHRVNEKQKRKESTNQDEESTNDEQDNIYSFIGEYKNENCWRPQGRIGSTLSIVGDHIFLIGGRSNQLIEDVAFIRIPSKKYQAPSWVRFSQNKTFDDSNEQRKNHYIKQQQINVRDQQQERLMHQLYGAKKKISALFNVNGNNGNSQSQRGSIFLQKVEEEDAFADQFKGRFNHTATVFNEFIIIFGGEGEFEGRGRARQCLNQVYLFNTQTLKWSQKICRGDYVEGRRNHTATILGNHLISFGGYNGQEKIINELIFLDLKEQIWKIYGNIGDYVDIFEKTGGLAYHTQLNVYADIKNHKLHNTKPMFRKSYHIKEQGIYFYGGIFSNDKINENMYVLKTESFPVEWKKLELTGQKPPKRYSHSMHLLQKQNLVVVSGGKTERKRDTIYLQDTYIFNLFDLEWQQVEYINPNKCFEHAFFSSDCKQSQIYIFGGQTKSNYHGTEIKILEFDQMKVQSLAHQQRLQQESGYYGDTFEYEAKHQMQLDKMASQMENVRSFMPIPAITPGGQSKSTSPKKQNKMAPILSKVSALSQFGFN